MRRTESISFPVPRVRVATVPTRLPLLSLPSDAPFASPVSANAAHRALRHRRDRRWAGRTRRRSSPRGARHRLRHVERRGQDRRQLASPIGIPFASSRPRATVACRACHSPRRQPTSATRTRWRTISSATPPASSCRFD